MRSKLSALVAIIGATVMTFAVLAQPASASSNRFTGNLVGPVASGCENWNSFGTGDFYTAPDAGDYSVRVSNQASDGTLTLEVRLSARNLDSGPVAITQHSYLVSHGFNGCTPDVPVTTAQADKHGRLRDARFEITWKSSGLSDDGPELVLTTADGSIYRTGPIEQVFGLN